MLNQKIWAQANKHITAIGKPREQEMEALSIMGFIGSGNRPISKAQTEGAESLVFF
jgi:hypothetical protein